MASKNQNKGIYEWANDGGWAREKYQSTHRPESDKDSKKRTDSIQREFDNAEAKTKEDEIRRNVVSSEVRTKVEAASKKVYENLKPAQVANALVEKYQSKGVDPNSRDWTKEAPPEPSKGKSKKKDGRGK